MGVRESPENLEVEDRICRLTPGIFRQLLAKNVLIAWISLADY